jgi:nicotinate phosphoribosyltransferase
VWRGAGGDVLGLRDETLPGESLLRQAMRRGERVETPGTIAAARSRFERDLAGIPSEALSLDAPRPRVARVSDALSALADEAKASALHRT